MSPDSCHAPPRSDRTSRRPAIVLWISTLLLILAPGAWAEPGGGSISGRWLHDGQPVGSGSILYVGEGNPARGVVRVEADGRFVVTGLKPGVYKVDADYLGGWLDASAGRRVVLGLSDATVTLNTYSTEVRGTIRDADGAPVPRASIWLEPAGQQPNPWTGKEVRYSGRTRAEGTFVFRGMAPGRWRLLASARGHAPTVAQVEVPSPSPSTRVERDVVLGEPSSFEFRAVGPDGRAPERLYTILTGDDVRTVVSTILLPDESGRFVLTDAPAGDWRLWIRGGRGTTLTSDITVPGRQEGTWRLPASGLVRFTGFEHLGLLSVRLSKDDGEPFWWPDSGLLDARRPALDQVLAPVGPWTVEVEGPDGYRWRGEVDVAQDEETVVELPPASRPPSSNGES